jgi:pilus assembly protein TadC
MPASSDQSQELDFTPVEGERPIPLGWRILFWGLIVFGAYYLWAYSPVLGGWSQGAELAQPAAEGAGANILATILFTALAIVAAVSILFSLARRKRQP